MNSTKPERNVRIHRNRNVPFQSKNRNGDRNGIDNYGPDHLSSPYKTFWLAPVLFYLYFFFIND